MEVQSLTPEGHPHKLVEDLIHDPVQSCTEKNGEEFHPANVSDFPGNSEVHGHLPGDIDASSKDCNSEKLINGIHTGVRMSHFAYLFGIHF